MSDPEILRRCPTCGAAFRSSAVFCPQCGTAVSPKSNSDVTQSDCGPDGEERVAEGPQPENNNRRDNKKSGGLTAEQIERRILTSYKVAHRKRTGKLARQRAAATKTETVRSRDTQPLAPPAGNKVETYHEEPAAPVTFERPVESVVEQPRKVSSVVIGEKTYDPSLRFLIVAAVLFVLFIVVLVLSKVIT